MKTFILKCFLTTTLIFTLLPPIRGHAQAKELAQLALNLEKLTQFKQILSDLKKGYEILSGGYKTINDISEGNFQLHKLFLDGLMQVNPSIKQYRHIADIVNYQVLLVEEYKQAINSSKSTGVFNPNEIEYMSRVYARLFDASIQNLDDLFTVITENKLRMSDEERLSAIDKIYFDMEDKLTFLRHFNNSNSVLSLQRLKEQKEVERMKAFEGIK
ncbi:TerB family tellurite resistance protein [Chitinophaga sp. 30R24]|uniref:TerB family tellurite resistance protein n=1 Tax=Chitinophaga sp. 30R24 TaxID=3248838 RepID=UPI003B9155DE